MAKQQNWAGNYTYSADKWYFPESINQVQQIVKDCDHLRVVGTRHSFNSIADSEENMVSVENLNQVVSLDKEKQTVTVEAGIKYSDLGEYLHKNGFALQNMASLPHISVGGACATATHGSGDQNSNLAAAVQALEVVTADGEVVTFSREKSPEQLDAVVVGLGGVGVVTKLTLNMVPTFQVRQDVYENLPLAQLEQHFDAITSSAYSVSLFTSWKEETFNQVWLKSTGADLENFEPAEDFFGASPAVENLHPLGLGAENCTEQMGVAGPWLERLSHFRTGFTPSSGEELQSEYIIPRQHGFEALKAVSRLREKIAPHLHVSEIRTIAQDTLWMSPSYKQNSVGIHFTWKDDWENVQKVLPEIEAALEPFQARPHWGKLFTMEPERVQALFEKLPDFRNLLLGYDPEGKFRNEFLNTYVFKD